MIIHYYYIYTIIYRVIGLNQKTIWGWFPRTRTTEPAGPTTRWGLLYCLDVRAPVSTPCIYISNPTNWGYQPWFIPKIVQLDYFSYSVIAHFLAGTHVQVWLFQIATPPAMVQYCGCAANVASASAWLQWLSLLEWWQQPFHKRMGLKIGQKGDIIIESES